MVNRLDKFRDMVKNYVFINEMYFEVVFIKMLIFF